MMATPTWALKHGLLCHCCVTSFQLAFFAVVDCSWSQVQEKEQIQVEMFTTVNPGMKVIESSKKDYHIFTLITAISTVFSNCLGQLSEEIYTGIIINKISPLLTSPYPSQLHQWVLSWSLGWSTESKTAVRMIKINDPNSFFFF